MKRLLISAGIVITCMVAQTSLAMAAIPAPALLGDSVGAACQGVDVTVNGSTGNGGNCGDNGAQLNKVIQASILIFSVVVGVVATIMIIVAGLTFITSNGDASKIAKARSGLIYGTVGLLVVALAQIIVHFVIGVGTLKF